MTAKSGFSLIPIGAKVAAALVFLAIVAGLNWFFVEGITYSARLDLLRGRISITQYISD